MRCLHYSAPRSIFQGRLSSSHKCCPPRNERLSHIVPKASWVHAGSPLLQGREKHHKNYIQYPGVTLGGSRAVFMPPDWRNHSMRDLLQDPEEAPEEAVPYHDPLYRVSPGCVRYVQQHVVPVPALQVSPSPSIGCMFFCTPGKWSPTP